MMRHSPCFIFANLVAMKARIFTQLMKPMSTLLPMDRRAQARLAFALFLLAGLLCSPIFPAWLAAPGGLPDTSKMNLLFIIIEDCYAGVWGSYGNPICKTPNMDRFARTAVQFDSAYVQAVCCNPSRTSFLTGLRPLTTRVWGNPQVMSEQLPPGTLTLPELLKKKGLHTAVIGKFFHMTEYAAAATDGLRPHRALFAAAGLEGPRRRCSSSRRSSAP